MELNIDFVPEEKREHPWRVYSSLDTGLNAIGSHNNFNTFFISRDRKKKLLKCNL